MAQFCRFCSAAMEDGSSFCRKCGKKVDFASANTTQQTSEPFAEPPMIGEKDNLITLLLAIFLGTLGVHRFYEGKIVTGILWLLTGGLLSVGWIIDIILIAVRFGSRGRYYRV
ncbi:TM2 domain-containing protein [Hallerella porci]|uniref:TM2 domain-containing protein n=1 Tax=Hallerella porci TaxID=1945871 RepID=A0ABX5LNX6_9BACT|nr:TM2 domain-containing protein [Hallerella porci]PWL01872.1 TM2 domain-containing protein [Hallerella porci]